MRDRESINNLDLFGICSTHRAMCDWLDRDQIELSLRTVSNRTYIMVYYNGLSNLSHLSTVGSSVAPEGSLQFGARAFLQLTMLGFATVPCKSGTHQCKCNIHILPCTCTINIVNQYKILERLNDTAGLNSVVWKNCISDSLKA